MPQAAACGAAHGREAAGPRCRPAPADPAPRLPEAVEAPLPPHVRLLRRLPAGIHRAAEATLRVRHGAAGAPVLLLHGHPRTHATWHGVAPRLARRHTVVCPDLRGYGGSSKPATRPGHAQQSKRAMAADCVALMRRLGHERFAVVGHDRRRLRGAARGPRPSRLGAAPSGARRGADRRGAGPLRRRLRAGRVALVLLRAARPARARHRCRPRRLVRQHAGEAAADGRGGLRRLPRRDRRPGHRARDAGGLPRRPGHRPRARRGRPPRGAAVACPVLLLWARDDDLQRLYGDPLAVWRAWADDMRGHAMPCGHHMAEELPERLARELLDFLA